MAMSWLKTGDSAGDGHPNHQLVGDSGPAGIMSHLTHESRRVHPVMSHHGGGLPVGDISYRYMYIVLYISVYNMYVYRNEKAFVIEFTTVGFSGFSYHSRPQNMIDRPATYAAGGWC